MLWFLRTRSRGKIRLQRSRVELGDLLRRTVEDHRTLFASRMIAVELRLGEVPIWIDADPTRLAQVVGNLLQNAAKFTDRGGHVEVSLERRATAVVRVRDDGVGIAAEVLARVFEPFTQADESLHRTPGGLGLGLALVKGLVELHGGSVEAHSRGPGRGTELVVQFPLAPEKPVLRGEAPGRMAPMAPLRVLVIEDNADAAGHPPRDRWRMRGDEVARRRTTGRGRRWSWRATFRPDVVLCDIGLPDDGRVRRRALRSRAEPALGGRPPGGGERVRAWASRRCSRPSRGSRACSRVAASARSGSQGPLATTAGSAVPSRRSPAVEGTYLGPRMEPPCKSSRPRFGSRCRTPPGFAACSRPGSSSSAPTVPTMCLRFQSR